MGSLGVIFVGRAGCRWGSWGPVELKLNVVGIPRVSMGFKLGALGVARGSSIQVECPRGLLESL